jgi:2-polyprenyl-6-methoxyphenol hydroxylase-like FAD-dependent oxidoreductase
MGMPFSPISIFKNELILKFDVYRLGGDVHFPRDCIQILRAAPYIFTARSCNKWALKRTILAGDSAHVFPQFGGVRI